MVIVSTELINTNSIYVEIVNCHVNYVKIVLNSALHAEAL